MKTMVKLLFCFLVVALLFFMVSCSSPFFLVFINLNHMIHKLFDGMQ